MRRLLLVLTFLTAAQGVAWAQTGGPVAVKALDTATGALTDVGDNTNHAIRVNIIAGAGSGGTAIADNAAFTQGTTQETPAGCLYNTSYANATTGHVTIPRCTITGDLYSNIDAVGGSAITLGAKTSANSFPVVLASDQATLTVKPTDACGTSVQDFEAQLTATTLTSVTATTTCVDSILVTNIGTAQTTILGQDVSTACSGGVCSMIPTTALAPNTSMTFNLNGLKFTGGIKLQANNANNIQYFIHGRQ